MKFSDVAMNVLKFQNLTGFFVKISECDWIFCLKDQNFTGIFVCKEGIW